MDQGDQQEAPSPRRRSPISRADGEKRLITATLELCRERPFGDVSVRDIAARADVNHGFVHRWFGSKADLVLAATGVLIDEIAPRVMTGEVRTTGLRSPDVILLIRLLAWLQTEPRAAIRFADRRRRVIETTADVIQGSYGFDSASAVSIAEIMTAAVAGTAMVGEILRFDDDAMMGTWLEMLGAYASRRV